MLGLGAWNGGLAERLWGADEVLANRSEAPDGIFRKCDGAARYNCVVDGDTFWYQGERVRIADIDTPEISEPSCRREEALGHEATRRLKELLNEGPFTLAIDASGRDTDRYGRLLRVVMRDGRSIGETLIEENLAVPWEGQRGYWCGGGTPGPWSWFTG